MRIKTDYCYWTDSGQTRNCSLRSAGPRLLVLMLIAAHNLHVSCVKEPFDLDFGPDAGDQFTWKGDGTRSEPIYINGPLMWGQAEVAYFKTESDIELFLYDQSGNQIGEIEVAYFDGKTQDNLLDKMCLQYDDYYANIESICDYMLDPNNPAEDYVRGFVRSTDSALRSVVYKIELLYEWNDLSFSKSSLGVYFDDLLTQVLTGPDTKYVNLANNVYVRNLTRSKDLEVVNNRIGGDFKADFGFVVTWYKIMDDDAETMFFSNVQLVVACDQKNTTDVQDNECYSMAEYDQLNPWEEEMDGFFYFSSYMEPFG